MTDAITAQELVEMKEIAERKAREADMAEGEKAALLKRLKEDHECKSVAEGKAMMASMDRNIAKRGAKLKADKEAFWEKYGDDL